jgi:ABC-type antimicrobial peptide transport system permease subunit
MHSLYRTLRTALRSLRRHIMRSALTCLGIVIGIASVIAIIEIGQGTNYSIQQTIAAIGANVIQIDPAHIVVAGVSSGAGGKPSLSPDDCDAILRECSAVRCGSPSVDCHMQIVYGNRNWSPMRILGTSPDYFVVRNWTNLAEGEMVTEHDVVSGARVCLVGQTIARELFKGESSIGKEIRVKNVALKVIGVLSAKGANMMGSDQDDFVAAPWTTIKFQLSGSRQSQAGATASSTTQAKAVSQLYPNQQVQLYPQKSAAQAANTPQMTRFNDLDDIWVSATSQEEIPQAIQQITSLLRERHHIPAGALDDFNIRNLTEISQTLASTQKTMIHLLTCVALISLIVGGVGIMNIMLASVTERTREIGVRMAIGARARDILRQFLTEAVILCLLGGAAGILLGRGASIAVTMFLKWKTMSSVPAIVAAFVVAASVGIVFGFYPAWKASRLDPIEALRYE